MFVGGLVLLTAIITWGIANWLNPYGESTSRPRWPARDWAIIGVLAVLAASSLYRLVWLQTVAF